MTIRFNDLADAGRLRNEKDSRTRLAFCEASSKVIHHGAPVMAHQNATLLSRDVKNLRIGNSFQPTVSGGSEIDGWFSKAKGLDQTVAQVSVGLETDQGRDSPILALATWSRSQSAGFSSAIGIPFSSNSRSVSTRYLSISA